MSSKEFNIQIERGEITNVQAVGFGILLLYGIVVIGEGSYAIKDRLFPPPQPPIGESVFKLNGIDIQQFYLDHEPVEGVYRSRDKKLFESVSDQNQLSLKRDFRLECGTSGTVQTIGNETIISVREQSCSKEIK